MKKRYSEEQIIKAIKEHEAGAKVDDLYRQLGISSGTLYNWRNPLLKRSVINGGITLSCAETGGSLHTFDKHID